MAAALARQIERDNLSELIAVAEAEHGPVTEEEISARRDQLRRARDDQQCQAPVPREAGAPARRARPSWTARAW